MEMTLTYDRDVADFARSITGPEPGENLITGKAICRPAPVPSGTLDPPATVGTVIGFDFPRYSYPVRRTLCMMHDPSLVVSGIVKRIESLRFGLTRRLPSFAGGNGASIGSAIPMWSGLLSLKGESNVE
jgi:hypothetical protein